MPAVATSSPSAAADILDALGMSVLERGWLSANQAVFRAGGEAPATVVDTGFGAHAAQTAVLVEHALEGAPLGRILNTHLHSDHCGGNAVLQGLGAVETWIPAASLAAVTAWNDDALSYRLTGQACPRFRANRALMPGATIAIGPARWEIHAAPGHDMDAILLFEPQTRTLIAGDALWERRLAIIFPELQGNSGFATTRRTLALIERLSPRLVVPGHGRPFEDVTAALAASRERIAAFEREPVRHARHAARALLMFHLLERRTADIEALLQWMAATPIYRAMAVLCGAADEAAWARGHVQKLVDDGALRRHGSRVTVPTEAQ